MLSSAGPHTWGRGGRPQSICLQVLAPRFPPLKCWAVSQECAEGGGELWRASPAGLFHYCDVYHPIPGHHGLHRLSGAQEST